MKTGIISFIIALISMILSGLAIYQFVAYINPPVTMDGHRYMPTSNILKSFVFSFIIAVIVFFAARKMIMRRNS
ncbi:hypothetical protein VUJ46_01665 [Chryseobacterium sp. MYb264]|uniref:hypothetical protein n=1 Tax=Chryseobacterium sp. MYb264 TaxID=2745153 RepID=UPI002E0E7389|nr:hypothetical protein VUJ46_01665 [Chryseobacterium sp. MYb264]